jgi:hypothetical protein
LAAADVAHRVLPAPLRWRLARRRAGLPTTARIFGIGLGRSGTSSLTEALQLLGYRSLHYPDDDRTREEVIAFLAAPRDRLRLTVLERLDAIVDTPICATFEALDAAYPGSKFILTIREKPSWLESWRRVWEVWLEPYLRNHPGEPGAVYMDAIHERVYGRTSFDRDHFAEAYDRYHARVRQHFDARPADLLTIDICAGEGWDPLCEFLGLPPPRAEFPWANRLSG